MLDFSDVHGHSLCVCTGKLRYWNENGANKQLKRTNFVQRMETMQFMASAAICYLRTSYVNYVEWATGTIHKPGKSMMSERFFICVL